MITFKGNAPVQATLRQLRRYRNQAGRQVFIVDDEGRLEGSVDIQDLALSPPKTVLSVLARPVKVAVDVIAPREEIALQDQRR